MRVYKREGIESERENGALLVPRLPLHKVALWGVTDPSTAVIHVWLTSIHIHLHRFHLRAEEERLAPGQASLCPLTSNTGWDDPVDLSLLGKGSKMSAFSIGYRCGAFIRGPFRECLLFRHLMNHTFIHLQTSGNVFNSIPCHFYYIHPCFFCFFLVLLGQSHHDFCTSTIAGMRAVHLISPVCHRWCRDRNAD